MAETDHISETIGSCGCFQILFAFLLTANLVPVVWALYFMAFGLYDPGWTCTQFGNSSMNGLPPITNGSYYPLTNKTQDYAYQNPAPGHSDFTYNGSDQCREFDRCEHIYFDQSASSIVTEWSLICDQAWIAPMMISIQMAGFLLGTIISGQLGDVFGRKSIIYTITFLHAAITFSSIYSVSWKMFAVFQFVIGFCCGGKQGTIMVFISEFQNNRYRAVYQSIPYWQLGTVSFALAVYLLRDWKQVQIASCVLSVLTFLPVFWVPESFRWLSVHGRVDEAKTVVAKAAKINKKDSPNFSVLEKIAAEEELRNKKERTYGYLDLFRYAVLRKRAFTMGFVYLSMSIVYNGITFGIKDFSGNFFVNLIISFASEYPGIIFVAIAANTIGRRWSFTLHNAVCVSSCFAAVGFSLLADGGVKDTGVFVAALLAKTLVCGAWEILNIMITEVFPTVIRNSSRGFSMAAVITGSMLSPYVIPRQTENMYISFVAMGTVMVLCNVLVLVFIPETKGKPMEDSIENNNHYQNVNLEKAHDAVEHDF